MLDLRGQCNISSLLVQTRQENAQIALRKKLPKDEIKTVLSHRVSTTLPRSISAVLGCDFEQMHIGRVSDQNRKQCCQTMCPNELLIFQVLHSPRFLHNHNLLILQTRFFPRLSPAHGWRGNGFIASFLTHVSAASSKERERVVGKGLAAKKKAVRTYAPWLLFTLGSFSPHNEISFFFFLTNISGGIKSSWKEEKDETMSKEVLQRLRFGGDLLLHA